MTDFPVGSDGAQFVHDAETTSLWCNFCDTELGTVTWLNQALVLWSKHLSEVAARHA